MAGERGGAGLEDRLRAIGWLLDARGLRLVALALRGDRATVWVAGGGGARTVALGPADLALLRCAARSMRGRSGPVAPGTCYQGLLRALGWQVDAHQGQACRLGQDDGGLVAHVLVGEGAAATWRILRLDRGGG